MFFIVVNPMNCSDINVFNTIESATEFLSTNGFVQLWSRDVKISPRARLAFVNNETNDMKFVYCRELGA